LNRAALEDFAAPLENDAASRNADDEVDVLGPPRDPP